MSVTHIDASEHEPSYYKLVSLHINDYRYFVYFPFDVYNQYISYHVIAKRCQGRT